MDKDKIYVLKSVFQTYKPQEFNRECCNCVVTDKIPFCIQGKREEGWKSGLEKHWETLTGDYPAIFPNVEKEKILSVFKEFARTGKIIPTPSVLVRHRSRNGHVG